MQKNYFLHLVEPSHAENPMHAGSTSCHHVRQILQPRYKGTTVCAERLICRWPIFRLSWSYNHSVQDRTPWICLALNQASARERERVEKQYRDHMLGAILNAQNQYTSWILLNHTLSIKQHPRMCWCCPDAQQDRCSCRGASIST